MNKSLDEMKHHWKASFCKDGYVGPIRVFDEVTASCLASRYLNELEQLSATSAQGQIASSSHWERSKKWVYDLATHPLLLEVASAYLGEDILMFGTSFWSRDPGESTTVPWHQDGPFWHFEPRRAVTAWLSLRESYPENGGIVVAQGSHKQKLPHEEAQTGHPNFSMHAVTDTISPNSIVGPRLKPGEAIVFTEMLAHCSGRCETDEPRLAFTARFCPTEVRFSRDPNHPDADRPLFLVKGDDDFQRNEHLAAAIPDS